VGRAWISTLRRALHRGARTHAWTAFLGVFPGILASLHLVGLLFFLNIDLPWRWQALARGLVRYGALLGALSLLLHLALSRGHAHRLRRLIPWSLAVVLTLAAAGYWGHAAYFGYYLPPGINLRLLKAGFILSAAALLALATVWIHTLRRRAYGRRSRLGLLFLAALSVFAAFERRDGYRPAPSPATVSALASASPGPPVWVIGIETATLDAILPLAEQGYLPFFKSLFDGGTALSVKTLRPVRQTPLWTTVASGKLPYKHGVLGPHLVTADFLDERARLGLLPQGIAFDRWGLLGTRRRPQLSTSRRTLALWEVLARSRQPTAVVGWPVTYPATAGATVLVSDRYFSVEGSDPELAFPADFVQRGRLYRVDTKSLDPLERERYAGAPEFVLKAHVADLWRLAVAQRLQAENPQLHGGFLYLPGLSTLTRNYYGGFAAAQAGKANGPEERLAERLVIAYLSHLDGELAAFWRRMTQPSVLVLVSAYGVQPVSGWRALWGKIRAAEALRGRVQAGGDGILLLYGAGIRHQTVVERAEITDIAPTLAYLHGLSIARDLDGKVLTSVFSSDFLARQTLSFVPSYDSLIELAR
jgi:Type I phosphodiesterase / nucleotide pyrophosphatase